MYFQFDIHIFNKENHSQKKLDHNVGSLCLLRKNASELAAKFLCK